jgi:hypothetical protein
MTLHFDSKRCGRISVGLALVLGLATLITALTWFLVSEASPLASLTHVGRRNPLFLLGVMVWHWVLFPNLVQKAGNQQRDRVGNQKIGTDLSLTLTKAGSVRGDPAVARHSPRAKE